MSAGLVGSALPASLPWLPLPPIPDAEGFAGGMAGVSRGMLLFAGGSNFIGRRPWEGGIKRYYDAVYALDSMRGYWRKVGALPRAIGYAVSGSYRDEVIVAGGCDRTETFDRVFALSWNGDELVRRDLPPLPRPRAFAGGTVVGHWLYVVGGTEASQWVATEAMADGWALDLGRSDAAWQPLPALPGPGRCYPIVAGTETEFWMFGGTALSADPAGRPLRTFLRDGYTCRLGQAWVRTSDLPYPLSGGPSPTVVTAEGTIRLFSGDDGTRTQLDGPNHPGFPETGLAYDPASDRWSALPAVPFSRATAATAVWNDHWVMMGGERKPGYRTPETWGLPLAGL